MLGLNDELIEIDWIIRVSHFIITSAVHSFSASKCGLRLFLFSKKTKWATSLCRKLGDKWTWMKLFCGKNCLNLASDDCPALLLPLETWASRLNIQYIIRPPRYISCCDITDSGGDSGLVRNGFLKVPLLYSCNKTEQGQSWECVECVCVTVPAAPTLPGHAGRHQGHTHKDKTLRAFGPLLIARHTSSF